MEGFGELTPWVQLGAVGIVCYICVMQMKWTHRQAERTQKVFQETLHSIRVDSREESRLIVEALGEEFGKIHGRIDNIQHDILSGDGCKYARVPDGT